MVSEELGDPRIDDTHSARKEEMIWQELEEKRFQVFVQAMNFSSLVIVDICVLFLRHGKELVVV